MRVETVPDLRGISRVFENEGFGNTPIASITRLGWQRRLA